MYDKSQLMRGTLEGCILKILSDQTTYGYEIVANLQDYGFEDVKEGTIYPVLHRMESSGLVMSYRKEAENGKSRKYYSITAGGKKRLTAEKEQWKEFTTAVNKVIGGENYALS